MAKGIAHRTWTLQRSDYETDQDFLAAVGNEMALAAHIMDRLGVAIVAAPIRRQWSEAGDWYSEAVMFRTATVPGVRRDDPHEPEENEPEEGMSLETDPEPDLTEREAF